MTSRTSCSPIYVLILYTSPVTSMEFYIYSNSGDLILWGWPPVYCLSFLNISMETNMYGI